MNKAKEWLKANGHIAEIGRGRISNDNHVRLLAAVDQGVKFSDYPKGGGKVVVSTPDAAPVYVKADAPTGTGIVSERPARYTDEKSWKAVPVGATIYSISEFGMREICNCGNSLTHCYCSRPVIHTNVRVEVVPRR